MTYTMLPPHGHCHNLYVYKQLQICIKISIYFVLSLMLNSFYNTALFDKKVSLFNLYVTRVGIMLPPHGYWLILP